MSDAKVLSQEEIDALLNAAPLSAPVATAAPPAPVAPAAVYLPEVKVVAAPPLTQRPAALAQAIGIDLSALQAKPGAAAPAAISSAVSSELAHKVDVLEKKLEKALDAAAAMEKRYEKLTDAIRKVAASVPKGTEQKIQLMWQGLQNTPDYNLYDKFVCKKCAAAGAAQMKARCGACGTEGWFGRKEGKKAS